MSQLVIVDVQQTFEGSKFLDEEILELSKNFSSVIFIQDIISGDGVFPHDMWTEMAIAYEEGDFTPKVITKEYAFFRGLMDKGCGEDFMVDLAKMMRANNIRDARDIEENENASKLLQSLYKAHGEDEIDFEGWGFYLPDLIEDLDGTVASGAILVGGGLDECLKEVSLVLRVLEIDHSIDQGFVY